MQEIPKLGDTRVFPGCISTLWQRVKYYLIDDPNSKQKFSDRLAKENLWTKEYAVRAMMEYKKFMFLAAASKDPVTPSLEVDEVWHLHMLYTRDYAEFCNILGSGFIHHGPGKGGKADDKFVDWYATTKQRYYMYFSEEPPEDIWPTSEVRFRNVHFAKVDLLTHWVVPGGDWKAAFRVFWQNVKWKLKQSLRI